MKRRYFQARSYVGAVLLLAGLSASAATPTQPATTKYSAAVTYSTWKRNFTEQSRSVLKILAARNAEPSGKLNPECEQSYNELYRDGVLDMTIALGYFDSRPVPYIQDTVLEKVIFDALTVRCGPNESGMAVVRTLIHRSCAKICALITPGITGIEGTSRT